MCLFQSNFFLLILILKVIYSTLWFIIINFFFHSIFIYISIIKNNFETNLGRDLENTIMLTRNGHECRTAKDVAAFIVYGLRTLASTYRIIGKILNLDTCPETIG